ncbi:MAG: hypothetical protein IJB59_07485 [Oscillospiraceae bacterium]|nr:hypothetical protein [Oscillospiraceae bacterium]
MCKRILSMLSVLLLLLSLALPAFAQEETGEQKQTLVIYHEVNFLKFAESCRLDSYSENLTVELRGNLDLTDMAFTGIPMFCGTFEGNGHTIRGLSLTQEGSDVGLFRYLRDTAVVQNLHVEGTIQPEGSRSRVGGIAGSNEGRIINCSFAGTVSGNDYVGGITGENRVTGVVENCRNEASVTGSHFVGGICGKSSGVIRQCENLGNVNDTAVENLVDLTGINLESLTRSEYAATVTDIGGIAGTSNGVIRGCINRADVGYRYMGYNIGGVAGSQSGLIQGCENHGQIRGRKEIGGIAGQMEPTALIEYEEDAIQILQRQLDGMGGIVNDTMSNIQGTGTTLMGQVGTLKNHVSTAKDAVDVLIPDPENPEIPDWDTIQAAQNNISSSLSGMNQTLQGLGSTAYSAVGAVSTNLHALQNQMNSMRNTLGNISETLGGSLTDVSDKDTDEDLTGKVSDCVNYGAVLADRNAGGIAGAMAMENDLDHEEDWTLKGSNSLNFESELRAVIANCDNYADITVKKENAGGITGWQSLGLVKNSRNCGDLDASAADNVGGISGQSKGFIRCCAARAEVSGGNHVGGIAGSATVLTDCRALVKLAASGEKTGVVLGAAETPYQDEKNPVAGNYYLILDQDQGGIDGISYAGEAEPLTMDEFLVQEGIPEQFRTVAVRFRYANGTERSFTVPLGGSFDKNWTPPLPPIPQAVTFWVGLEEADLTDLMFDVEFEPGSTSQRTVLGSNQLLNGQPLLLLQGSFSQEADLTVEPLTEGIPEADGEILGAWRFAATGAQTVTTARLRLPKDADGEHAKVLLRGADGVWRHQEAEPDGSCLVVPVSMGDDALLLYRTEGMSALLLVLAGAAIPLLAGLIWHRIKKKAE